MEKQFLSKSVPKGTRTIWRYLGALFILFTFAIGNVWAANVPAAAGTYSVVGKKPGNANRFYKLGNGVYIHRINNSSWDSSMGMKIPSDNQNGVAVYLSSSMKVSALINKKSDKNAVNVELKAYPITNGSTTFDAFEAGSDNSTEITVTHSSTASYTLSTSFAKLDSKAAENKSTNEVTFAAGYYYIVGTDDLGTTYLTSITLTAASSDPVDPTASFSNGDYTIGGSDLDLSTLFTTNSDGAVTFTITDQGTSDAALRADGKSLYATTAGSATVKVEQAATSSYKAFETTATITVSAFVPITSISLDYNEQHIYVGDVITITPTILPANASNKTLLWSVTSGASITQDGVLTAEAESDVIVTAAAQDGSDKEGTSHIYIDALPTCATLTPAESGSTISAGDAIDLQESAPNASMKALTANLSYTENGLLFGDNSSTKAEVTLNNLMQVGTVITATIYNDNNDKARGLNLLNSAGTSKATWTKTQIGDHVETYTVVAGDGLAGSNVFQLQRNNNAYLKDISIANCGAELHALTSAIYPAEAEGKATITLSKNFVENGGTATATYSAIDAAYDFDEWVISGEGASISSASANPVTITMGSNPATITLKLKAAGTKYPVHFDSKGGSTVDDQLVDEGGHAAVPNAPTKFKYTFGGWSETDGGSIPANLAEIAINAEKTFYAIWTPKACPTSGTIFSFVSDGAKAPSSNTYCPASGVQGVVDIATYATVSGGLAQGVHTTTSDNPIQIQTSTSAVKLSHADGYFRALLECPLQEGDTIKFGKTNKVKMAFDSLRTKVVEIASGTGANKDYYVVPSTYAGVDTIMVYYGGSSVSMTSLQVIRPAKFEVTFNLHGHGTPIAPQLVLDGGKVTEPADPSESGWDFDGWYATYVADPESYDNEWNFDNDVVNAATELHAKWTEHVVSNDVALGTLSVNGEAITIVPSQLVYAVELPFGTTAIPTVAATAADANAKACNVTQALAVDGSATIYVKAEDNTTEATYTINFSVATSKDIELVWDKSKERCDATKPDANVLIAAMSEYLSASYTGSAAEGGSLTTGKTTGSKIIITAKPGYAFKAMGFYGKIEDGTCNFYNDGVVETIGTSTGDACYANVFSNDEVHEFVIELTGSNGVYIRNMQLTIIEACTPIVVAWDEEPVEFEVGKDDYVIAATANNGEDVAYSSTDDAVIAVDASTGALTVSALGSVTLKASTAEGDGTTYCANGGEDIVISKVVNTYYLVKFDAQNGEPADEVKFYASSTEIALPADPTFAGYDFQGWFDAETGGNQYVEDIIPTASITVYAQWVAQCDGATITTQPVGASYLTGRTPADLVCEATAGAGGALTYEWFTCEDDQKTNPVAASATPSTAVAGTFYYFCKVTEAGCGVEAFSDVVTITVTDKDPICIIKSIPTSGTEANVDGVYQGNAFFKGRANDKKLNSKYDHVGVQLKDGYTFLATDKVVLNQVAAVSGSDLSKFYVFAEVPADGKTYATVLNASPVQGDNWFAMPAEIVGQSSLYVGRVDANCNPTVGYLAVYRACAPILSKVTVNGVDGTPDNTNHVAIEVPFSTADDALDAIVYDWVSNNDAWTAAHAPAVANAWEWGVENTLTFADKDGDESVYYVTISKAAASSDATLSSLSYGTPATAIALADGVYEYNVELPYGTSSVPALAATAHHAGANVTEIDDAEAFVNRQATSTVTVKSEDNTVQIYTVNFTVSRYESKLIWDGSTMTQMSDITAAATAAGVSITTTGVGVTSFSAKTCEENGKSYPRALDFGGKTKSDRYFGIEIPAGKVAKVSLVYRAKGTGRSIMVATALSDAVDESTITSKEAVDGSNLYIMTADMFGGGTLYINTTDGYHVHEISLQLADGHARSAMLGNGVLGTVCVPNNVAVEDIQGVTVYELVGREPEYGKLAFDEIISGELEAGVPYLFQAHGNHMAMLYGEDNVANPVDKHNGMYGTFEQKVLSGDQLDGVYYFAQKALWSCDGALDLTIAANRAYVKLGEINYLDANQQNPAPGRRRITMAVNGEQVATGIDELNASEKPVKMIINGQLFIIRGEKMYDAKGQLVK